METGQFCPVFVSLRRKTMKAFIEEYGLVIAIAAVILVLLAITGFLVDGPIKEAIHKMMQDFVAE